jgi:2',3'-cyclic-nucleotide 2'-phosphodiesterase (5'-nucleotidase family)
VETRGSRGMKLSSLLLPAASLLAVFASSDLKVDRLVSRRLQKRDAQANYNISIFHVNDVHAHLEEYKPSGTNCTDPSAGCIAGYARLKDKIDELRPGRKNSLLLNLGDEFQVCHYGIIIWTTLTPDHTGYSVLSVLRRREDRGDNQPARVRRHGTRESRV